MKRPRKPNVHKPAKQVRFVGHNVSDAPKHLTVGKVYKVWGFIPRGAGSWWIRNDEDKLVAYSARGFEVA